MVFVASLAVKYHHTSFGITPQMLQASRDFDQREPRTETRTKYARDRSEFCEYSMMVKATNFSREIGCLEHVAWHEKNNGGTRSHCKEHLVMDKNAILALSRRDIGIHMIHKEQDLHQCCTITWPRHVVPEKQSIAEQQRLQAVSSMRHCMAA